jgi:hypothetical protein
MYDPKARRLRKAIDLWHLLGRFEREGHQSRSQALWDIARLYRRNRISTAYYLATGLYRQGIPWSAKLAYMNPARQKECLSVINPVPFQYVVINKIVTFGVLATFGIPTPPFYGRVDRIDAPWHGMSLRSVSDLLRLIRRLGVDEICFKHVSGTRGKGFFKVKILADGQEPRVRIQPKGEEMPLARFWDTLLDSKRFDGYFCQGVVDQHPALAELCTASLNTVRTWMAQGEDGRWSMQAAMLRIGLGDTSVDNISAGNMAASIDVPSGCLTVACREQPVRSVSSRHPVTGAKIEGKTLPDWPDAVALCTRTAELFPYFGLLTTDVAFSTHGPVIVELGATPDDSQIFFDRGVGPLLKKLVARRCRGTV